MISTSGSNRRVPSESEGRKEKATVTRNLISPCLAFSTKQVLRGNHRNKVQVKEEGTHACIIDTIRDCYICSFRLSHPPRSAWLWSSKDLELNDGKINTNAPQAAILCNSPLAPAASTNCETGSIPPCRESKSATASGAERASCERGCHWSCSAP